MSLLQRRWLQQTKSSEGSLVSLRLQLVHTSDLSAPPTLYSTGNVHTVLLLVHTSDTVLVHTSDTRLQDGLVSTFIFKFVCGEGGSTVLYSTCPHLGHCTCPHLRNCTVLYCPLLGHCTVLYYTLRHCTLLYLSTPLTLYCTCTHCTVHTRGKIGVHNIFCESRTNVKTNICEHNNFLNPDFRWKPTSVNTTFFDLKPRFSCKSTSVNV